VPRLKLDSRRTIMVQVPRAEPGGRFTLSFESHLIELLEKCRTVKGAATLGRITADQIEGVMTRAVRRGLLRRVAVPLSVLEFDEPEHRGDSPPLSYIKSGQKAYRKGQQYVTVLTDPEGHRVLDVARGRTEATAVQLLEELPAAVREAVKAVVMDMWPAYRAAAEQVLPKAAVVYDKLMSLRSTLRAACGSLPHCVRLHISMHLNKAVDTVRQPGTAN
jgi:transposase